MHRTQPIHSLSESITNVNFPHREVLEFSLGTTVAVLYLLYAGIQCFAQRHFSRADACCYSDETSLSVWKQKLSFFLKLPIALKHPFLLLQQECLSIVSTLFPPSSSHDGGLPGGEQLVRPGHPQDSFQRKCHHCRAPAPLGLHPFSFQAQGQEWPAEIWRHYLWL